MAQLAIIGHKERGKEVIEILEMLGGVNHYKISYADLDLLYTIRSQDNFIIAVYPTNTFVVFTLEEFLEKYPYKIGDKVIYHESKAYIKSMRWDGIEIVYKVECNKELWDTTMFYLQPYKEETMEEKKINQMSIANCDLEEVEIVLGDKFELVNREGKYYAVKKKPKYPKTYDECCEVLGMTFDYPDIRMVSTEEFYLYSKFIQLKRCRDAYWKIAGDWKPDWKESDGGYRYCIHNQSNKIILSNEWLGENYILSFPTQEMRDAFYENFKELIEECKEFL